MVEKMWEGERVVVSGYAADGRILPRERDEKKTGTFYKGDRIANKS
jgi:hypothetical protein